MLEREKSPKNSVKECVFINSALKIQLHIVKSTLLQTAFSAILRTGMYEIKLTHFGATCLSFEIEEDQRLTVLFHFLDTLLDSIVFINRIIVGIVVIVISWHVNIFR